MQRASLVLCLGTALILVGIWRYLPRTETQATVYGYIEHDRWTGHARACSVEPPDMWLRSPGKDPPRVCVDLD